MGECIENSLPFPDYPKVYATERKEARRNKLIQDMMIRLCPLTAFWKIPKNMIELKLILERCNADDTEESLLMVVLPALRSRLLTPLLMEEENAAADVARELIMMEMEPKHLLVHMRELRDETVEEDMYELLTDKIKADLLREFKRLRKEILIDPDEFSDEENKMEQRTYDKGKKGEATSGKAARKRPNKRSETAALKQQVSEIEKGMDEFDLGGDGGLLSDDEQAIARDKEDEAELANAL
mmetsp:Transcript_17605/g.31595  ORF Transcript_17605/g.31595 Transcript_17605/m.31595 type:complete len:241 (-) Transcript_17605:140-862(-)